MINLLDRPIEDLKRLFLCHYKKYINDFKIEYINDLGKQIIIYNEELDIEFKILSNVYHFYSANYYKTKVYDDAAYSCIIKENIEKYNDYIDITKYNKLNENKLTYRYYGFYNLNMIFIKIDGINFLYIKLKYKYKNNIIKYLKSDDLIETINRLYKNYELNKYFYNYKLFCIFGDDPKIKLKIENLFIYNLYIILYLEWLVMLKLLQNQKH